MRKSLDPFLVQMGAKIKAKRNEKGLFLRDLAPMVGFGYQAICDIENGKASVKILNLVAIAKALDCDVKDFL